MRKQVILLAVLALTVPLVFFGCSGDDGATGAQGPQGVAGNPGAPGAPGISGAAPVSTFHGQAAITAEEVTVENITRPTITITSASVASGITTVHFTVMNGADPVTGITACSAGIFKLAPAGGGLSYNRWVPYIYRTVPVHTVNAGYRESTTSTPVHGTLTDNGGGNYTYTFGTNLTTAAYLFPVDNQTLVGYDPARTHRVSIYMGGHSGPTGEGDFDFVPGGGAVTQTRNIVQTATCKKCHGPEFAGHGGDRVTVQGCNGCHSPNSFLVNTAANGGTTESIAMQDMIHKIHAGRELPSSQGIDNQFYDNPNTPEDETADNYQRFGAAYAYTVGRLDASWRTAAFPAVIENCQVCHTTTDTSGAEPVQNVDNWKTVPSRSACGSCHDTIDFAGGGHMGQTTDSGCSACHPATGSAIAIVDAHNWTTKDIRNIPEYNVDLTVSTPENGEFFENGETPVISIALSDYFTGTPIAPDSVIQDNTSEGCIPLAGFEGTECTVAADTFFTAANVYVTGPRGRRTQVLTYNARAKVTSASVGPWDLSAGDAFGLRVDSGMPLVWYNNAAVYEGYGQDEYISGDIEVPFDNTAFADNAAATPAEVAAWLNANPDFNKRAFAYVENYPATNVVNRLSIRSRGLSKYENTASGNLVVRETTAQPNVLITADPVGMFAANAFGTAGGAAQARIRPVASTSATDPKASFPATGAITYTLDPVDDLVAGTYVVNIEFANRGRGPTNPAEPPYTDYRTPTTAVATFQVKQAATEKPIADSCTNCHWSNDAGRGFILDFPRHHKVFDNNAVDQCGGCHMYKSGMNPLTAGTESAPADFGTKPLSRRVHAVHDGANLNFPTITVGHEETAAFGRNWNITYPQNIRNCQSCHSTDGTSGTWATNPNRIACGGCHDSDAATAHLKANTFDPTPNAPFSGDEQESCKTCHQSAQP